MARSKPNSPHSKKQKKAPAPAEAFPTMFFESISSASAPAPERAPKEESPRDNARASRGSVERMVWMWSGVCVVMAVIFLAWAQLMNASGILNMHTWFQKDTAIQQGKKSLQYYFEKQNADQAALSALVNQSVPAFQTAASSTSPQPAPALANDQINALKERINALTANGAPHDATASNPSSSAK